MFKFLKYIQPTHYFGLKKINGKGTFPNCELLPEIILGQLEVDDHYQSHQAKCFDLSWQAIHKGYIGACESSRDYKNIPLTDEYRFLRKYFNRAWVLYVYLFRLISLNNPFKETQAFFYSRDVERSSYLNIPIEHSGWQDFNSELLLSKPKVSVIIPTLNRYTYLRDVLRDLELQNYVDFDVIVIDQSDPFKREFYNEFDLDLKVIYQKEKALWLARNEAIRASANDYLLFFDDDSRVNENWIRMHLNALDFFNADVSSGVSISKAGGEVPKHYSFFRISDQIDTGNVLIKRKVFNTVGLFDRQFEKQRMGDGEFGLRVHLEGFTNISNPLAKRLHLKVGSGGLRQMGSWDAFRTRGMFSPRPIPSVLYFFRCYFGNERARLALMRSIPMSVIPYRFKKNKKILVLGVLLIFLLTPLIFFQISRSWYISSKMLREGPKIEPLN